MSSSKVGLELVPDAVIFAAIFFFFIANGRKLLVSRPALGEKKVFGSHIFTNVFVFFFFSEFPKAFSHVTEL